jgi:hypothetical protein
MKFLRLRLHSGIFLFSLVIAVFIAGSTVKLVFAAPACTTSGLNQGLISAENISGGALGNTDTTCVLDAQAAYRSFNVPSYSDLESQFYTFSRAPANVKKTTQLQGGAQAFNGDGIYQLNSSLNITGAAGTGIQIIFIRGNLDITGNIDYPSNAADDSTSGLVFIASGDIHIHRLVTRVDAVLISAGTICTAWDYGPNSCMTPRSQDYTQQLVINGSLISLNKTPLTNQGAILLRRNLATNDRPAEIINKESKYLYILKSGLFTKDLILTYEDKIYSIPAYAPPVNGGWSWSACSAACGGGTQTAIACNNPTPANDGANCSALPTTQACNTQPCVACSNTNPLSISTVQSVDTCFISI